MNNYRNINLKRFLPIAIVIAFVSGVVLANGIESGLVQAFSSISKNLFGPFSSANLTASAATGVDKVQLNIAPEADVPFVLNVFDRDDADGTCAVYAQFSVEKVSGVIRVQANYDSTAHDPHDVDVTGIDDFGVDPNYPPDPIHCVELAPH